MVVVIVVAAVMVVITTYNHIQPHTSALYWHKKWNDFYTHKSNAYVHPLHVRLNERSNKNQ